MVSKAAVTSSGSELGTEHPATKLSVFNQDQQQTLIKLQPINLPNTDFDKDHAIHTLRNSWKYIYVVNWIYNCRGYAKMQLEFFDVDLFETELLGLVYPPPLDESVLFINKLRTGLISVVQGSKCSPNNFEKIFRIWFGSKTPLGGRDEDEEGDIEVVQQKEEEQEQLKEEGEVYEPTFDNLSIEDKFEILYIMIEYISGYENFRKWMDKNLVTPDSLRITPLNTIQASKGISESIVCVFDNTRIYKRTMKYPELVIPKKRKLATKEPDVFYNDSKFDIKQEPEFELISMGIYEYNDYVHELSKSSKKSSSLQKQVYQAVTTANFKDILLTAEIKKRKFITNRKKELQLANLLATRKRSSRLEAKEKLRQEELRALKIQEEEELRIAAQLRLERRRLARNENEIGLGLTREERLRMRREPEIKAEVDPAPVTEVSEAVEAQEIRSDLEVAETVPTVATEGENDGNGADAPISEEAIDNPDSVLEQSVLEQPISELVSEPVLESVSEPVSELVSEPVTEQAVSEPETEEVIQIENKPIVGEFNSV